MNIHWELLADCLRQEVADYGGLLSLFEEQQRSLFDRNADAVLRFATQIEQQSRDLSECRTRREQAVATFAVERGQPATATLRSLLPLIEAQVRPLFEALIREVNALVHRVRRTSRHNHTLLARSVELHQETIQQLRPGSFNTTYAATGRSSATVAFAAGTLRAAG